VSDTRLNIVWATPVVPYPPRDGGVIRIYQLLKGLAERHRVHLLAMTYGEAVADTAKLKDFCQSIELFTMPDPSPRWSPAWCHEKWKMVRGPHHSYYVPELQRRLDRLCETQNADVVMLETLKMAEYRPLGNCARRKDNVILSRQNYEPDLLRRMADEASAVTDRVVWRASAELLDRAERQVARKFKFITAVSEKDAERFRSLAPETEVAVVPNAADPDLFRPVAADDARGTPIVAIVGTMEYPPNRDAARFFCQAMWPEIRQRCPDAKLRIIGNAAAKYVPDLAQDPGVETREPAGDIAAELEAATVIAVPLRIGSGTRIKILEALAAGKAVVSTSIGCEGLDLVSGEHLLVADDPSDFATKVVALLTEPSLRRRLAAQGRKIVEERYTWPLSVKRLEAFCRHVAEVSHASAPAQLQEC